MISKKRVFVSFDFDNDKILKDFIIGQSKNPDSPFDVIDSSMKEAAPERNWEDEAWERINRSDIVIVMLGPWTHRASGVLKEVNMARLAKKPVYQIVGYRNSTPTSIPQAGQVLPWDWNILKQLLS